MKKLYMILYITGAMLIIIAILGGNLTGFIFRNLSEETLNQAGIKKQSVDSLDNRIDDIFYSINKVKLKIEQFREFFGGEEPNPKEYQKLKQQLIYKNIYNPSVEILSNFYRFTFLLISLCIILGAGVIQVIHRNLDLRRRVERLEEMLK